MKDKTRLVQAVKLIAFASVLAAMCILGILWFLRPTESVLEKRELAQWPKFTLASFWDGSFFSGIDTWYSDTYPAREEMISAQKDMEGHYGIRDTQMIGGGIVADAIPVAGENDTSAPEEPADPDAAPTPTPTPVPTTAPDGTIHEVGEFAAGGIYITHNSAYGGYYFSQAGADAYIDTMNQVYQNIGDKVNMYVMNPPISASVMLDETVWNDIGCSDEGAAIDYVCSKLDPGIKTVDVYDTLRAHNAEYIYFRADHHWTQLGAYYAYTVFCNVKGITPHDINDYDVRTFAENRFLGSYYTSSNKSPELAVNPDTVYAYTPKGTNDMEMIMQDGTHLDWEIIFDDWEYPDSETYCIFSGADRPFAHAHNDSITDGSAVLVVKDSFANAFIPWLIDHYEDVYWVDYRYTDNTVSQMVADYGVQDVIFEAAMSLATSMGSNSAYLSIGQ